MGAFSTTHLLIAAAVALLLFGNRLPQAMRGLGLGIAEFKRGMNDLEPDVQQQISQDTRQEPARAAGAEVAHDAKTA